VSEASVYRCPACGAPADPKAAACSYCAAKLSPVRCPWCFEWVDAAAKDCPRCGAAEAAPVSGAEPKTCPTCRAEGTLSTRAIGAARLAGCSKCGGVWADAESFKRLCEDRATQTAYLGKGTVAPAPQKSDPTSDPVVYRPCPVCADLMNRFNFAGCSGVILDACKPHGVWFDVDELRRIVLFIRGGGLDVARDIEREKLEDERRRLERERTADDLLARYSPGFGQAPDHITSAADLLAHLFDAYRRP
jgi:Zn-finger nucleic acid-binding protein